MEWKIFFVALFVTFALTKVQAENNIKLTQLIGRLLEDLDHDENTVKERTTDEEKQKALEEVYEKYKVDLEEWEMKERHTKEAFATAFAAGEKLQKFVLDEANGDMSASDLLSEQIKAVRSCYVAGNGLVVSQTERKHFLENNFNVESEWESLQLFNTENCKEMDTVVSKMQYQSRIAFATWIVIADEFISAMKHFTDDMYVVWEECLDKERENVNQGGAYVALKCEHEVAYDGLWIVNHLSMLHELLLDNGGRYDNALQEYKDGLNSIANPENCMAIDDFVEDVQQLETISQVRKENEELLKKMNQGYIQTFSKWLESV